MVRRVHNHFQNHTGRVMRDSGTVAAGSVTRALADQLGACDPNPSREGMMPSNVARKWAGKSLVAIAQGAVSVIGSRLSALGPDRSGNVAVMTALALPVLLGAAGLGVETSYWYVTQRAMQNAADSAAVAAATIGGADYDTEARAVAAQYGFKDGEHNVSVSAEKLTCTTGEPDCYKVTVTGYVPLFLSQLVGYEGVSLPEGASDAAKHHTKLSTKAVARRVGSPRDYCVMAMGDKPAKFPDDILVHGGSKADLEGCGLMSNGTMQCDGKGGIAAYGDSPSGDLSPCGTTVNRRPVPPLPLPQKYEDLAASNIPAHACPANPPDVVWSTDLTKALSTTEPTKICGTLKLTGNVTITTSSVIIIYNGGLNLQNYVLRGDSLTIVFAGPDPAGIYKHTIISPSGGGPTNNAKLQITAPTAANASTVTKPWIGVALYQDPSLTGTGINFSEAGNSPKLDVTGVAYFRNASVTVSGAINGDRTTKTCFVLVVDSLLVNGGGGAILSDGSKCAGLGVEMPSLLRGQLVE